MQTQLKLNVLLYASCKRQEKHQKKTPVFKGTFRRKRHFDRTACSLYIEYFLSSMEAAWANLAPGKYIPTIMCLWLCLRIGKNAHGCDFELLGASRKEDSRIYILAGLALELKE